MKTIIDDQVCLANGVTLSETLLMVAIKNMEKDDASNLCARGYLIRQNGKYEITTEGKSLLRKLVLNHTTPEERLRELAIQMQKCFPEGKKPDTPYYFRCNVSEVMKKMERFFTLYGDFPDEKIISATKRFVASFNGDYRYLPLIKYFITKNKIVADEEGITRSVEYSPLADYLENEEPEDMVNVSTDDWLMNAKN